MAELVRFEERDGKVSVAAPYAEEFVRLARQSGGKWDRARRVWVWSADNADLARKAVRDVYGIDVDAPQPLVTVEVDAGCLPEEGNRLLLGGLTVATRFYRDSQVRLADNAVVVNGGLFSPSGGSRNKPRVEAGYDTWLRVTDVTPAQVEWLKANVPDDGWRLVTPESERADGLRAERERLLKRVAEIDAELARIGGGHVQEG